MRFFWLFLVISIIFSGVAFAQEDGGEDFGSEEGFSEFDEGTPEGDEGAEEGGEPEDGAEEGFEEGGEPEDGAEEGGEPEDGAEEGFEEGGEPEDGAEDGGEPEDGAEEGFEEGGEPEDGAEEGFEEGGEPEDGAEEGGEPEDGTEEGGEEGFEEGGEPEDGEETVEEGGEPEDGEETVEEGGEPEEGVEGGGEPEDGEEGFEDGGEPEDGEETVDEGGTPEESADSSAGGDYDNRLNRLEKIIREQKAQIEGLQEQLAEEKTEEEEESTDSQEFDRKYIEDIVRDYVSTSEPQSNVLMGYEDGSGFYLSDSYGDFKLVFSGYVQTGVGIFENDTIDNNGFFFNGVYLTFDAFLYRQWQARIQIDITNVRDEGEGLFQNGQALDPRMRDAYIQYIGIPEFQVRVGQTHVPFTIEGQYAEYAGLSIFSEPFIASWSHGRDIGVMVLGTLGDVFEYKAGVFNGEGENTINDTDDVLLGGQIRIYPFKKSENSESFIHIGGLRTRDDILNQDGDFGSARLVSPWGRRLFGDNLNLNNENNAQTQGWRTAVDVGAKFVIGNLRIEAEAMFFEWERKFDAVRLGRIRGYGFGGGFNYLINLSGKDDGSGLFPTVKVSYTDLDNYHNTNLAASVIDGQSLFVYTVGLGYKFNYHVSVNFNWIMLDIDREDLNPPDEDQNDTRDDLENGVFIQVTTVW